MVRRGIGDEAKQISRGKLLRVEWLLVRMLNNFLHCNGKKLPDFEGRK